MQIQISTDHNIKGSHEFLSKNESFKEIVQDALGHFQQYVVKIKIYFTDVNAGKAGFEDKRCLIEARINGTRPIVASHHANNLIEALGGAAEKLKHSLNHTLGKMRHH